LEEWFCGRDGGRLEEIFAARDPRERIPGSAKRIQRLQAEGRLF